HNAQARHDLLHVIETAHIANERANQVSEDDEVQRQCNSQRQQRLRPDAQKAAKLLNQDGRERDPLRPCCHARFSPGMLRSTRRMNNSSSRLALLRMLMTWMFRVASWLKTSLSAIVLGTSISSVRASRSRTSMPSSAGAC